MTPLLRALDRVGIRINSVRDLSALTLSTGVATIAAFLAQLLLARGLGPDGYGAFATATTAVTLVSPLAAFGVGKLLMRVFGAEGWYGWQWLRGSVLLMAIWTATALTVLVAWALLSGVHPTIRLLTLILAPTVLLYPLSELVYARLQLEERYMTLARLQPVPNLVRFGVAALAVGIGWTEQGTAIGIALALMGVCLLYVTFIAGIRTRGLRLAGHGDPPASYRIGASRTPVIRVALEAWPFALAGVFYLVYFQSDVLLLGWLVGPEPAGAYNVAFAVMAAVYLLPSIVHQKYLLPKLHRWAVHDRERFLDVFRFGNGTTFVLGIIVMIGVAIVAPVGIPWVFGEAYEASGRVLLLLSLGIPFRYLATSVGAALVTQDHMRRKVWLMGLCAIINLLLNLALIPRYSMYGAASATIVSELVLLAGYLWATRRFVFGPDAWRGWTLQLARRGDPE
jgi:O-antigen/teichoic acid export membrane protein